MFTLTNSDFMVSNYYVHYFFIINDVITLDNVVHALCYLMFSLLLVQ